MSRRKQSAWEIRFELLVAIPAAILDGTVSYIIRIVKAKRK